MSDIDVSRSSIPSGSEDDGSAAGSDADEEEQVVVVTQTKTKRAQITVRSHANIRGRIAGGLEGASSLQKP